MGLNYHFKLGAPGSRTAAELVAFLKGVEKEAQKMGFKPTIVLDAYFDTAERKQFARRLTTGLPVEDVRLKGADLPDDSRVWHHDSTSGSCRLPPLRGVVMVVTDGLGEYVRHSIQLPAADTNSTKPRSEVTRQHVGQQ